MANMQNSKSAGEFDDAAQTASATGQTTADELGTRPGGGALRRLLAQGQPTPAALAALLKTLPQPAWPPILLEAQRDLQLGNSFVQQAVQLAQAHAFPFGAPVQGAQAMGAEAFASGNQIELGNSPELHTLAHEAAHVVQQGQQSQPGQGQQGQQPQPGQGQQRNGPSRRVLAGDSFFPQRQIRPSDRHDVGSSDEYES